MSARRLGFAFAVGLGLTLATAAIAVAARGTGHASAPSLAALRGVNFVSACGFSHRANDDPIMFPGKPGLSHDHSFVGARTTSAFSTVETLRASSSSCERPGHTAAYWMPSLVVDGRIVPPSGATIYYRRSTLSPVAVFPAGFRMISGDAKATEPQERRVTFWNCGLASGVRPSSTVPACPGGRGSALRLHVTFPSCWDGQNLDSASHQAHVAYPRRGHCPSTHPTAVPAISLIYRYPAIPSNASVALASGGQYSAHADFLNGWHQATLQSLVDGCLNALRQCRRGA
jgi:hypothetical protein